VRVSQQRMKLRPMRPKPLMATLSTFYLLKKAARVKIEISKKKVNL
jgi:hypothetical protein